MALVTSEGSTASAEHLTSAEQQVLLNCIHLTIIIMQFQRTAWMKYLVDYHILRAMHQHFACKHYIFPAGQNNRCKVTEFNYPCPKAYRKEWK